MPLDWLVVNAPAVVSEIIDGEVVIRHLEAGHDHSADGAGAVIWSWVEEGRSLADIERAACERFDAPVEVVLAGVDEFIFRLRTKDLVRAPGADQTAPQLSPVTPPASREPFQAPALRTFTDMRDRRRRARVMVLTG